MTWVGNFLTLSIMNKKFQIYGLLDPITGELRYIGQTIGKLRRRLSKHICEAKKGGINYHKNCWIKSILNKNLRPEIYLLEEVETLKELDEAEVWHIQYWRSIGCNLTNLAPGGKSNKGVKHSLENRINMSIGHGHNPIIDQFGNIYNTPPEACEKLGITLQGLGGVLHKRIYQTKGYTFNYLEDGRPDFDLKAFKKEMGIKFSRSHGGKPFCDQDGTVYQSTMEAERVLGFDHSGVQKVLSGKRKQCNGYTFKYLVEF